MSSLLRVVIDANLHQSAHRPGASPVHAVARAWRQGLVRPLVSPEVLADVDSALRKEDINLSESEIVDFFAQYKERYEMVLPPEKPPIPQCRDAADQCYLELAYAGKADVLISGDKDLLMMAGVFPVPILNARNFIERFF